MKSNSDHKKKWRELNPERARAQALLTYAIAIGDIKPPRECSRCKKHTSVIEGHHTDYSKPLEVTWLCRPCHRDVHLDFAFGLTLSQGTNRERIECALTRTFLLKEILPENLIAEKLDISNTSLRKFLRPHVASYGSIRMKVFEKIEANLDKLCERMGLPGTGADLESWLDKYHKPEKAGEQE